MNFFVIKKRHLCLILCAILLLVGLGTYFGLTAQACQPNLSPTVVIDAGHGGVDVKLGQYIKQKSILPDML